MQAPLLHTSLEAQALPQKPQLASSVWGLTSQPVSGLPSQLRKPLLQKKRHTPAAQDAVLLLPAGQTAPQKPQLLGSVSRFVSHPFAGFPSQSAKGENGAQTKPHVKVMGLQVGIAPGSSGHGVQDAPQDPMLRSLTHMPSQLCCPAGQPGAVVVVVVVVGADVVVVVGAAVVVVGVVVVVVVGVAVVVVGAEVVVVVGTAVVVVEVAVVVVVGAEVVVG